VDSFPFWLPVVFFLIATVYSTVGFGGGSSYLAVLALVGITYTVIPQTALVCNLVVAGVGVWYFVRNGQIDFPRVLPFLVLSIPMAYLGGRLPVARNLFMVLLGVSLFVAGLRTLLPPPRAGVFSGLSIRRGWIVGLPVGAALGFLSGLVGIGGGIFLAPVLILTGWGDARRTAAASALFILVNSAAGLTGQWVKGFHLDVMVLPLLFAVFLGGQIGARLASYRLPVSGVQRLLSVLILFVSVRVLWGVF